MITNKKREPMLKSLISSAFFWLILLVAFLPEVHASATKSAGRFLASNCITAGDITSISGNTICAGTPVTFTISNYTGNITGWVISTDLNFNPAQTNLILTNQNSITLSQGLSSNAYIKVMFLSSDINTCTELVSNTFLFPVVEAVEENIITPSTNSFGCTPAENIIINGNAPSTLAGDVIYEWQMSFNGNSWSTVSSGPNSVNLTMVQYPNQSVYFRRLIHSAACTSSISNIVLISYNGASNGGVLSGGGLYCLGEQEIQLSLSGYNGNIVEWQYSENGADFNSLGGAGESTYSVYNLLTTTYFRVAVQQAGCELVYSNTVELTISQLIENNAISSSQSICLGEIPQPLTGTIPTGGIEGIGFSILWQMQTEGSDTWINIPFSSIVDETYTFLEPLELTTHFQRIVSDAECSYSESEVITITVINPVETITNIELCDGGSYTLPNGNTVNTAGSYSILYSSQLTGCDSTATYNVELVTLENAGTFSDSSQQTVCFANATAPISLIGFSGTIESWYTSDNIDGPWNSLNNSANPITLDSVTSTTYLKALVSIPGCSSVWSEVYTITVLAPISNNIISANQWICNYSVPQPLTGSIPNGGNGTYSFQWQYSYNLIDWSNVATGGNSFNYNNLSISQTTHFRRLVSSGVCLMDASNVVTVELIQEPSGFLTAPENVCSGITNEIAVNLIGTPPFEITFSDGVEILTVNNISQNSFTISFTTTASLTYTLLGVSDYYCTAQNFTPSVVNISVIPPQPAIDAGMDAFVCGLSHTLNGSTIESSYYNAYWTDGNGNLLNEGVSLNAVANTSGTQTYIYFIENELCSISVSDTVLVTYDLPVISNAGQNQIICGETTQLDANAIETGQGYWLIPAGININNPFDNNAIISGLITGETYNLQWVAESEFGVCNADTTSVSITVNESSEAGQVAALSTQICYGSTAQLSANNYVGSIIGWITTNENGSFITYETSASFESNALSTNTTFSVIVQAGLCAPDTSEAITIFVDPITQPGLLEGSTSFCEIENEGELTMTNFSGNILWWEISENNFETYTQILSEQTTYYYQNINVTTQFRTMIQSGVCEPVYSNVAVIEINEYPTAQFEIEPAFCSADSPLNLNSLLPTGTTGTWLINGLENNTLNPSDYADNDVTITLITGQGNCLTEYEQTTHVFSTPTANAGPNTEVCGNEVMLSAIPSTGNGVWSANDEILFDGNTHASAVNIISLAYGTQSIIWTETNGQCTASDVVEVTFWQSPSEANAGENQNLSFTYNTTLQAESPEVGTAFWSSLNPELSFVDINDPKTEVRNLQIGENKLFWNVTNGNCELTRSEVIVFVNPLVIPNGFTPNGDNVNDFYIIEGIENVAPVKLTVVNRWGERVYESANYLNQWEGKHKNGNELPEDTYYYSISSTQFGINLTGFIVLKR